MYRRIVSFFTCNFSLELLLCLLASLLCCEIKSQGQSVKSDPGSLLVSEFVEANVNELIRRITTNDREKAAFFGPCLGKANPDLNKMRKAFNNRLTSMFRDSTKLLFEQRRTGKSLFAGKSRARVIANAKSYALNEKIKIRIDNFIRQGCDDIPVPSPNRSPKANAGTDQTVRLPDILQLQGTGTDPDNDTLTFNWTKLSSVDNSVIVSPRTASTPVRNLAPGRYQYRLTVADNHGASDTSEVTVTVVATQQPRPPVANAGPDATIYLPQNKTSLTGSVTDAEGAPFTYNWIKSSGKAAQIVSRSEAVTEVEGLTEGTYIFLLTVTNRYRLSDTDQVKITVAPAVNHLPTVNAGPDKQITLPQNSVEVSGSASDADNDRIAFKWRYKSDPSNFQIRSIDSPTTIIDNLTEGSYIFILEATDGRSHPVADSVMVTVNPPNIASNSLPVAFAGPDTTLDLSKNSSIILQGSGVDSDGSIVSYQWSGPESFRFEVDNEAFGRIANPPQGIHELQLTVTDNRGGTATDTVLLQVVRTGTNTSTWVIIALVAIGIGLATWLTIRYLWWSQSQKVIAYYLNKQEEGLVNRYIPDGNRTDGYSVGYLSRRKIRMLKRRGIAFRILNTKKLIVNTPGVEREYNFDYKKGEYIWKHEAAQVREGHFANIVKMDSNISADESDYPSFFIITLDSPLLPEFQAELDKIGISVIQRIPYDSYIIVVPDSEAQERLKKGTITHLKFIRVIRPYLPVDTGFLVLNEKLSTEKASSRAWTVDLVLHREEDAGRLRDFLGINRIEVIDSRKNIIRVRIKRDQRLVQLLASNKYIQAIYEHLPPILHTDFARRIIGLREKQDPAGSSCLVETGVGELVAVADTGIDRHHPDLQGRIRQAISWGRKDLDDTSDPHGHGTHVTGSIVGTGVKSDFTLCGIAPGAEIFFQSLLTSDNDIVDLQLNMPPLLEQAFAAGARIMNISWGSPTNSAYTFDSIAVDDFVFDNPEMIVIVSAGNNNTMTTDRRGKEISLFGSIGSFATTKNGITVGASKSDRDQEDAESIAPFSSRGPCLPERRIKPDLVAPGTRILSTRSSRGSTSNFDGHTNNFYAFLHGSSMAAPLVSGAAALVRQYYRQTRNNPYPSAALIKATILNGTRQLNSESAMQNSSMIPNNCQGFGMLDLKMTVPNRVLNFNLQFRDAISDPAFQVTETGKTKLFTIRLQQCSWMRVCLVFMDSPKISTQNDLNLLVSLEGSTIKWTGNAGINADDRYMSHRDDDFTNNIEVVRIENPAGGLYTIAVAATVAPLRYPVGFALVVTTDDATATLTP